MIIEVQQLRDAIDSVIWEECDEICELKNHCCEKCSCRDWMWSCEHQVYVCANCGNIFTDNTY